MWPRTVPRAPQVLFIYWIKEPHSESPHNRVMAWLGSFLLLRNLIVFAAFSVNLLALSKGQVHVRPQSAEGSDMASYAVVVVVTNSDWTIYIYIYITLAKGPRYLFKGPIKPAHIPFLIDPFPTTRFLTATPQFIYTRPKNCNRPTRPRPRNYILTKRNPQRYDPDFQKLDMFASVAAN